MSNPKHTPGNNRTKHPKQAVVIWFNRQKGFGEYASKTGPVFFTAYDVKFGTTPVWPVPGQPVELRATRKLKLDGSVL